MDRPRSDATLTTERFYELAVEAKQAALDSALARFSSAMRMRNPMAIALRGMKLVTSGDAAGGIALLKRAQGHATGALRQYLIELLVPLLINVNDIESAADTLAEADESISELSPPFNALRAVIAARTGNDSESAEYAREALNYGRGLDKAILVGKVLQRCALAAFYREDLDEAEERALEAARWYERMEYHRNAATAYSLLYIIAHDWSGDPDLAMYHARRMTMNARLGGDIPLEHRGLLAQLDVAVESGDEHQVTSLHRRLRAKPLNEQFYLERFVLSMSEVLANGWEGRFEAARVALTALRNNEALSLAERSLCDALLGIIALSSWHTELARRLARRTLTQTAARSHPEPLFDTRRRHIARILAAALSVALGDAVRGRRSLSRAVDPDGTYAKLITGAGIDELHAPLLFRGYARFLNKAIGCAERMRPSHGLTKAEIEVLRALPEGQTLGTIAAELGKSRKTVERQVGSIYSKLHVMNRAQAVRRARDLGLAQDGVSGKSLS